jgi:CRP/FNR family cyclic AMP-dependent transcriptional regulator
MEDSRPTNDGPHPQDEAVIPGPPVSDPELPQLGILVGLGQRSLTHLASFGRFERFPVGMEIIREDELQDRFYVVIEGQLSISAHTCGREVPLSTAQAGECLGEVSLLDPGPASASIRVTEDAILWSMDIVALREYLWAHTGDAGILLMGMASCLSNRLRQANLLISQHHVVPIPVAYSMERAITADRTPVHLGFFDRIKKSLGADKDKKIRISTKIKM